MAKKRSKWSEKEYEKRIKQGRGQGKGKDYLPWVTIHDFPSKGIVTRTLGRKTNRVCHLLSGLESDYFVILDDMENVEDIREQFPLRLMDTTILAHELNISHPRIPGVAFPMVMTTDFLITRKDGTLLARSVKPSCELEDKRTCEKLMLECEYWKRRGVNWKIVTEKEINSQRALNLRWLYYGKGNNDPNQYLSYEAAFLKLYDDPTIPFPTILEIIEEGFGLEKGKGMEIFKSLVRQRKILLDLEKKINFTEPRNMRNG